MKPSALLVRLATVSLLTFGVTSCDKVKELTGIGAEEKEDEKDKDKDEDEDEKEDEEPAAEEPSAKPAEDTPPPVSEDAGAPAPADADAGAQDAGAASADAGTASADAGTASDDPLAKVVRYDADEKKLSGTATLERDVSARTGASNGFNEVAKLVKGDTVTKVAEYQTFTLVTWEKDTKKGAGWIDTDTAFKPDQPPPTVTPTSTTPTPTPTTTTPPPPVPTTTPTPTPTPTPPPPPAPTTTAPSKPWMNLKKKKKTG